MSEVLFLDDSDRYSRLRLIHWWDQEKLRAYFPADKSVDFVLLVASRMYGLKFVEAPAAAWHPDRLRSLILDSAYPARPPDIWFPTDWATGRDGLVRGFLAQARLLLHRLL